MDARRIEYHSPRTVLAAVLAAVLGGVLDGVRKADAVGHPEVYPETFFERAGLASLGQVWFRMFWKRKNPAQLSAGCDSPAEAVERIVEMPLPHTIKLYGWRQRRQVLRTGETISCRKLSEAVQRVY